MTEAYGPRARERVDALPRGSFIVAPLHDHWVGKHDSCPPESSCRPREVFGALIVRREDDRVVVTQADPLVQAWPELVQEMLDPANDRVTHEHIDGDADTPGRDILRFGTEGCGLGVVAYEIAGRSGSIGEYVTLRRVE